MPLMTGKSPSTPRIQRKIQDPPKPYSLMKKSRFNCFSAALICLLAAPAALADTYYWDANGATPGTGGSNTYGSTSTRWTTDPTGSIATVALAGGLNNDYIFEGTPGTITFNGSFSGNSWSFNTDYTLTTGTGASATRTLSLIAGATGTFSLAAGVNLTVTSFADPTPLGINISAPITGTATSSVTITGGAFGTELATLSGLSTFGGGTTISGGTLRLGTSSTFAGGAVASGPTGTGPVTLAQGATLDTLATSRVLGASTFFVNGDVNIGKPATTSRLLLAGPIDLGGGQRTLALFRNGTVTAQLGSGTEAFRLGQQANGPAVSISSGTLRLVSDASVTTTYTAARFDGATTAISFTGNSGLTIGDRVIAFSQSANPFGTTSETLPKLTVEAGGYYNMNDGGTGSLGTTVFSLTGAGTVTNLDTNGGTATLVVAGSDATIFSGSITDGANLNATLGTAAAANTFTALTHGGLGSLNLSGTNSYTGATTVRSGTLEISGTNSGTAYTISNNVDNGVGNEPVLKLGNLSALPLGAKITGADSTLRDGTVDLAVAGAYTMSSYERGNIIFTASSGSPTTLTFTDASKITVGGNTNRTLVNNSSNLSLVFASTLDIGGDVVTNVNITGPGNTTVTGGILSTGTSARGLAKGGSGTLTINGASSYTGATTINGGVLRLGDVNALPGGIGATGGTSNLVFNASTGVIGLNGDFLRPVGPGPDQVTANPTADPALGQSMGFAAFGGDRLVEFGTSIMLSSTSYAGVGLALGAVTSDSKVTVVNDINLASSSRTVLVNDGSAAVDAELSGVISSAAATLVKTGTGTLALTGTNSYGSASGGTQVLAGVLLVDGDSLSDTSKLVIDGGKLDLNGAETVGTLFFGGVQQDAGTYGPLGSVLPIIESANFTGPGTLVVTTDPVTDSYTPWANSFGLENPWVTVANPELNGEPTADADNDGMSNQQEYAFGLTPNSGSSVNPIIVQLSKTTGLFTYTRRLPSLTTPALGFGYEYSTTLSGAWTSFTPDSTSSNSGSPVEEIIVDVPDALLANPALFVRVTAQ